MQVNNLDLAVGIKVIDRTELILQIFARRARTAESQIQVELAQLQYLASRIPVSVKQARFSGRHRHARPGRKSFPITPRAHDGAHHDSETQAQGNPKAARIDARTAPVARGMPGRIHQRGQVHPAERADRRRRLRGRPALCHAGYQEPLSTCPQSRRFQRCRRVCPTSARSCSRTPWGLSGICPMGWSPRSAQTLEEIGEADLLLMWRTPAIVMCASKSTSCRPR